MNKSTLAMLVFCVGASQTALAESTVDLQSLEVLKEARVSQAEFQKAIVHPKNIACGNYDYGGSTITDGNYDYGGSTITDGNYDYSGSTITDGNYDYSGSTLTDGNYSYGNSDAIVDSHSPDAAMPSPMMRH